MSKLRAVAVAVPIPVHAPGSDAQIKNAHAPARPQEAELRASALLIEADRRICFVSCDTLIIPADVQEEAAARIEAATGIPFTDLLICATHTHHAPCTIDILGAKRDAAFCNRLLHAIVQAVVEASQALDNAKPGRSDVQLLFAQTQEATVGMNSRYLLKDGTIAWHAYAWEDVVRPTGPYDPDMAVLAFKRRDDSLAGLLFNHSVHNIGALTKGAISPAFYGLACQETQARHGAVTLFMPGAFGSTHNTGGFGCTENIHAVSAAECVHRVTGAIDKGLSYAEPVRVQTVKVLKRRFSYRMRTFDEAREAAAVKYWTEKYTPDSAESQQRMFRDMRAQMAPVQGQERQTWLQVIRLGKVALVGVPGEMFAALGMEIRRRSPFRHTYVIGLANDTIGYIGDRESYGLGGYQLWAGLHSLSEPGTGDAMVEQALEMLREAKAAGSG